MNNTTAVLDKAVNDHADSESTSTATEAKGRGSRVANSAVSLKSLLVGGLIAVLIAGVCALGFMLHAKSNDLDNLNAASADRAHAEQIALDYATGAAEMDFKDLGPWRTRLTAGTSPELANRLTQAATSMEQIISPLQWVAQSTPIVAKVRSEDNGIYTVDCFVSVQTTNSQAPEGIQSTATYQLTIDRSNDWLITEIGGIDSALPGAPR